MTLLHLFSEFWTIESIEFEFSSVDDHLDVFFLDTGWNTLLYELIYTEQIYVVSLVFFFSSSGILRYLASFDVCHWNERKKRTAWLIVFFIL